MAAVENILATNTAPRKDVARAPSKVPFAPILASQIEARISDLAAPRAAQPANNDRLEARRDTPGDDRIRHEERDTRTDNASRPDRPRADNARREDVTTDRPDADRLPAHATKEARHASDEPRSEAVTPQSTSKSGVSETPKTDTSDTPASETASAKDTVSSGPTDKADSADAGVGTDTTPIVSGAVDLAEVPAAPIAVAAMDLTGPVSNGAKPTSNTISPSGAIASVPINGSGSAPSTPVNGIGAPLPQDPTAGSKPDGKINIAGMTPSNDDAPSKIGSDVPQIVREVQSIVARPANAAGGNLVQAHQQGEASIQQNLNAPAQPSNAAPLSQNAGQGAPLHVGADGSGNTSQNGNQNAGQNASQNGGQSGGNPNGQAANGQGINGQSGIAGAQPAGLPGEATASQQAAQSFQSNLARSTGPVGAGGPGPISGDGATMARGDGAIASTGAAQGTLASDPASRAAQAGASPQSRNAPATDQVSVSLKKAVENGDSKLRIQLRPHDLGRVEVKLDIAGDGRAKAMVLAERPETLELLQRDSRVLERALQDAGLKTDHNSLSFDLQGRDGEERTQQAQRGDAEDKGSSAESGDDGDAIENSEHPIPATAIGLAPDGSVNFLA